MKTISCTLLSGLLLSLLAGGCQIVRVEDMDGKPIYWAAVQTLEKDQIDPLDKNPDYQEAAMYPVYTDRFGKAILMVHLENEPEWLLVSKEGYESVRMDRPKEGRVRIKLKKDMDYVSPDAETEE